MKRLFKITVILTALLCCTGCHYNDVKKNPVSEVTQAAEDSIGETSQNSDTEISNILSEASDKKNESSLKSSNENSSNKSSVVSEIEESSNSNESSQKESSQLSDEKSSEVSNEESSQVSDEESSREPKKIIDESIVYAIETKYFVKKLDDKLMQSFLQMYDAVQNFEICAKFDENILSESLDGLMLLLNYDCPELIQLNGDYSPMYADEDCKTVSGVYFTYNMDKEEYNKYINELHVFFETLKADIGEKNELEKEKYVYDMIFNNCVYDDSEKYSGTVYGTLINHIGRCEGICKSFMWCMRELGSECMCVSGMPKWETQAIYAGHSWNIVKIHGRYYQLDLTVDNIKESQDDIKYPNYGFFNVNDEFNDNTHEVYGFYRELGLPECKSDRQNYHKMHNLFVYAENDIKEQVIEILKKNFKDKKINNISIKFENNDVLNIGHVNINEWIDEFFKEKCIDVYDCNITYNEICQTITVYAGVFDDGE